MQELSIDFLGDTSLFGRPLREGEERSDQSRETEEEEEEDEDEEEEEEEEEDDDSEEVSIILRTQMSDGQYQGDNMPKNQYYVDGL